MIESEDEISSSGPEDIHKQVGHQFVLCVNKVISFTTT